MPQVESTVLTRQEPGSPTGEPVSKQEQRVRRQKLVSRCEALLERHEEHLTAALQKEVFSVEGQWQPQYWLRSLSSTANPLRSASLLAGVKDLLCHPTHCAGQRPANLEL